MGDLGKTRAFDRGALQELLEGGLRLMDAAVEITEDIESTIKTMQEIAGEIPSEARDEAFIGGLSGVLGRLRKDEFYELKSRLQNTLDKLLMDIYSYDQKAAELMKESTGLCRRCLAVIEDIRGMVGNAGGSYADFQNQFALLERKLSEQTNTANQEMEQMLRSMKGMDTWSTAYSKDPVNLCTGNFIYKKADLTIDAIYPLRFGRFYNAMNERQGRLGYNWNHTYEIWLEADQEEDILTFVMEDGREEIYQKKEAGKYWPLRYTGAAVVETKAGYLYQSQEGIRYTFDQDGKHIRQEDAHGNGITLYYEKEDLIKVEADSGAHLTFSYQSEGLLDEAQDHSGRSLHFHYEKGLLTQIRDAAGQETHYQYHENNKLKAVINANGVQTVKNEYDPSGRVIRQTFPDGGRMQYEYQDEQQKVIVTEQNGNQIAYYYDEKFRHIKTKYYDGKELFAYNRMNKKAYYKDKRGNKTSYYYNREGNISKVKRADENEIKYRYDQEKRITEITYAGAAKVSNSYREDGRVAETKDAIGRCCQYQYDQRGQLHTIIHPDKSSVKLTYDPAGHITSVTDSTGRKHCYEYDCLGRVIASTDGNGHRSEFEYNERDEIITVRNAAGYERRYDYNRLGKLVGLKDFNETRYRWEYNCCNRVEKIIDPEGNSTCFEYDLMWKVVKRTEANGASTHYEYDLLGRLIRVENARGAAVTYGYDADGNRIYIEGTKGERIEFEYDEMNRKTRISRNGKLLKKYTYHKLGFLEAIENAAGQKQTFQYDQAGQLIRETDFSGREKTYAYTNLGKLEQVTDFNGQVIRYQYQPGGLLSGVCYATGEAVHYEYDQNHNIISKTNHAGYRLDYTYDSDNRIIRVESSTGQSKCFTYDPAGNLLSASDGNGRTEHYTYTKNGSLSGVMDESGNETAYEYDAMNQLTAITVFEGMSDCQKTKRLNEDQRSIQRTTYRRNELGQITAIEDPLGKMEEYFYHESGLLMGEKDKEGNQTRYSYNEEGLLESICYDDGKAVKLSYDALQRLTEVQDWIGSIKIERNESGRITRVEDPYGNRTEYGWDANGSKESMTYPDGRKICYEYDDLSRLTKIKTKQNELRYEYDSYNRLVHKSNQNGLETRYEYDQAGMLSELSHLNGGQLLERLRYGYDPAGNVVRIEKSREGIAEDSGLFEYAYDCQNRLRQVMKDQCLIREYGYDGFGNRAYLLEGERQTRYRYNALNQLISLEKGEETESFAYDERGNIREKRCHGITRESYRFDCRNQLTSFWREDQGETAFSYNGLGNRILKRVMDKDAALISESRYQYDITKRFHNL